MSQESASSEFAGTPLVLTAGIFYDDPENVRFETSLLFAEIARDEGVPAVFVDGSPEKAPGNHPDWAPTWVADAHRAKGAVVLRADIGGIATQRQQGVAYAVTRGAEKIVGTESEKPLIPLFADKFSRALDDHDVLVIGRTPVAENSLPPVQQRTERLAGWILERTHALPADPLAGPRGFTVAGAEALATYPSHRQGMNNWIYLYETPMEARRRGLRVGGVAASFVYPEGMVKEETGNPAFDAKRLMQFEMQFDHLLDHDRYIRAINTGRIPADVPTPQSRDIAEFVLTGLPLIKSADRSLDEKLEATGVMEERFRSYGYQPAERLQVQ